MRELEKYVRENFPDELEKVIRDFANEFPKLTDAEKTIIYKYSDDDFTFFGVNKTLRESEGLIVPEFAKYLDLALSKLPNYVGTVYRGTPLTDIEFKRYTQALEYETPITEHFFVSSSHLINIAEGYGDFQFKIFSKTGKSIEKISKFGVQNFDNEYEVLFPKESSFEVLEISQTRFFTYISLNEL